ncbi:transmembrane protein [Perilla frutescens var. hirtella]|uniref:Transmembrane protein n=1 Tax=Perilla frutescens var. hirtella TaxID=608512 RepID=A0AAD4J5V9_PERFH|nr:transmembrane protein [Perilla frutescens var. hirtella]
MGKRASLYFAVSLVALSIFLNSSSVLCHPRDPFKSILGEGNTGSWKDQIMSSVGEAPVPGPANASSTLVLAENRTKRPDILSKFHKYRGGWDIANKHYWASVGFTGVAAFILAVLWFLSFGVALAVHYSCGWKINITGNESSWSLRICLLLLILFTSAAAVGCILLSVGQVEFHGEAMHTLNYVVNQSEYTVETLRNVTEYLSMAKTVSVAQIFLPSDVKDDIDRLNLDLNSAADTLEQKTDENSGKIRNVFNAVRSALIIVAAVMLLISVLGLALSIFGHQHAIHIFIISGWLLVAVTFILCGVFVILDNTISDTCLAMGEWVENPQAETALSNILPCVDQRTTNQTLYKSKQVINDIANMVNGFVGSVADSNPPPQAGSSYYNQSGPVIPPLCYPYDSQLQDRTCSASEISMENASTVWQNYTCTVSGYGLCTSVGRLTPSMYTELVAAVNVSYALEHYAPLLLNLQNCNFVRDTFRNITTSYCPPLEHYLRVVNAGLALISVGVMLSLALWILYANRPQREEVFAKLSSRIRRGCSGKTSCGSEINVASAGTTPRRAGTTPGRGV